jgi:hypothetical protein
MKLNDLIEAVKHLREAGEGRVEPFCNVFVQVESGR